MDTNSRRPTRAPGLAQDYPALEKPRRWRPGIKTLLNRAIEKLKEEAEKAQKDFEAEEAKVKQALKEENGESARSYAENAIRIKNRWSKLNRLASRATIRIYQVHTDQIVRKLIRQLKTDVGANDQEKVPALMDRLEQLAQDLDTHSWAMEDALISAPTLTTDQEQVDKFLQERAEEIKREENCNHLSQLSNIPSIMGESPKGIGQD